MKTFVALSVLAAVDSHGIFWSPKSRAQIAQENGYEVDSTTIISEPMPEVASNRQYPGGRPFAEPGKSKTVVGPCGMKSYGKKTNWNQPGHGWGSVQARFAPGSIIDVEWCVSDIADHGGLYSYRLCTDDSLVAKFTDPTLYRLHRRLGTSAMPDALRSLQAGKC